jgi:acyl-CoA synthetase (NDP forming)
MNHTDVEAILRRASARGDRALLESEGLEILDALGINTPERLFIESADEARLSYAARIPGRRVVVKVVSRDILHKTEVGGVAVVANDHAHVAATIEGMAQRLKEHTVAGYSVNQFIEHDAALGSELLLGLRWTDDFGAVATVSAGGIATEFLAANLKPGGNVALLAPTMTDEEIARSLAGVTVVRLLTESLRGQPPRLPLDQLVATVRKFLSLAAFVPSFISECEINPLVVSGQSLVAVDALVKLTAQVINDTPAHRPVQKIKNLLEPRSIAIIGVSEKLNPGHIIVNNLLREGFDRDRIYIVKPNSDHIEGCRCFDTIAALPERVDLFVLSVNAAQTPDVVREIIEMQKAESLIIIPGGLEEKSGGDAMVAGMRTRLAASRHTEWQGPVINGGNCLGIRSLPGRYDTMFIPEYKLPVPKTAASSVAFISQSGALAISKMSKLAALNPKYAITVGNQMDLTIGDYLTYLKDDRDTGLFAVYVEGFKAGDGARFLEAAREITASGRTVILYRAGRTAAGARAASSHTAAIAGDYAVTRALSEAAGVVVADTLEDFEDLVRLFARLKDKQVAGLRLGALSNAGFECVAMADHLGDFQLPSLSESTTAQLRNVLARCRIEQMVDAHNPLDLTPMADDATYEAAARAIINDANVDVGIVGCVPLTAALNTLAPNAAHTEDLSSDGAIAMRLARLKDETAKAWLAVVDSGALYDAMAELLEARGVPVFRTADRALRLFNIFCRERLRQSERDVKTKATASL